MQRLKYVDSYTTDNYLLFKIYRVSMTERQHLTAATKNWRDSAS